MLWGFSPDLSPFLGPVGIMKLCPGGVLYSHVREKQSQVAGVWVWRDVLVADEVKSTPGTDEGRVRSNLWTKEGPGSCWENR